MTINLNDVENIQKLDSSNVYESIISLPKQCLDAFEKTQNFSIPSNYPSIDKILMTGMGGSGLGARIIESVYGKNLKYPLLRLNNYGLPSWVDEKTLVICSSFSGTTEETVENAHKAIEKNIKWMAIGTGGELIDLAKKNNVPYYQIDPVYNPSKQPRLAIGYSLIGQLMLLAKNSVINFNKLDLDKSIEVMNKIIESSAIEIPEENNSTKQIAKKIVDKQVIFIGADHMIGAIHTIKNQMNENSKHMAQIHEIPELNHHLMEALRFPESNSQNLVFILIKSNLYSERIKQRFEITKDIIQKNNIEVIEWEATSENYLTQTFEFIQFGGFINYYLSALHNIDSAPIPWVDYFKTQLGQPLGQFK